MQYTYLPARRGLPKAGAFEKIDMQVIAVMEDKIGMIGIHAVGRMFIHISMHVGQCKFDCKGQVLTDILKRAVIIPDQAVLI